MSMTTMDNLGVMTHNRGAVVNLLGDLLTVLSDDVLALFDVGGVHHGLAHGPGHLALVLLGDLVALSVLLLLALGAARVSSIAGLSISLGLSLPLTVSVTMGDNLGVVTNNSRAVADLL